MLSNAFMGCGTVTGEIGVISELMELVALFKSLMACNDLSEISSTKLFES